MSERSGKTLLGVGGDDTPCVEVLDESEPPQSSSRSSAVGRSLAKTLDFSFRSGAVLSGRFVVDRLIGVGGQCYVYEAHHYSLKQRYAIKTLRPELLRDPSFTDRFAREAEAMTAIRNAHVAAVIDAGRAACGAPFIVMEFLAGRDLGSFLDTRPALSLRSALDILLQTCEGVAAAHSLGLVHQDIKPANIFLAEEMGVIRAKVVDFGVARLARVRKTRGSIRELQNEDVLAGTPLYMSPEQLMGGNVDARSDVFALGLVLYEMLRGSIEFEREMMGRSLGSPIVLNREALDRDAGPVVTDVIARCVELDPAKRFGDVGELAVALLPFAPSRARANVESTLAILDAHRPRGQRSSLASVFPSVVPPAADRATSDTPAAREASTPHAARATSRARRWLMIASVGATVALAVAALAAARRPSASGTTGTTSATTQRSDGPLVAPSVTSLAQPATPIATPVATAAPMIEIVETPAARAPRRAAGSGPARASAAPSATSKSSTEPPVPRAPVDDRSDLGF
ncbi:MAG: serine/threonine protein kinase [Deltaproteobacteria bacterium]|nr:serine/threonine protein kinase [Deltaproteobacteria bacterium]